MIRPAPRLLPLPQQIRRMHPQRFGQLIQRAEGQVFLSAFYRPDVSTVQVALGREFLLRPSPLLAQSPDDGGDNANGLAALHARRMAVCCP
ncbi:MAG: hypothetical protein QOF78_2562 [Phycisphaerales bacterium]|nr:hypothetical protein [Phycisphaerales bacterium]